MKKLFLIFCTIAFYAAVHAQSLAPVVVASAGTNLAGANGGMEYTVGEVATSTLSVSGNTLTHGFHQPKIVITAIEDPQGNQDLVVYPNPTEQFVTVENRSDEDMIVHLYDALGQTVIEATPLAQKTTLDLHSLSNGTYLLMVTRQNGEQLKNFSLIKRSTF